MSPSTNTNGRFSCFDRSDVKSMKLITASRDALYDESIISVDLSPLNNDPRLAGSEKYFCNPKIICSIVLAANTSPYPSGKI